MAENPQHAGERTAAARALLVAPWQPAEQDPGLFVLIRRHAETLDRWFTQRLGYRLVVQADTARLVKAGHLPADRPLLTHTGRPFTGREYVMLALVLAATASGPDRISLRDLVLQVRSAAADAGVAVEAGRVERKLLATALRWLIARGVVRELDRTVAGFETDGEDALLEMRNDRLAMLPTPALVGAESADELLERAVGDIGGRAAVRRRLVEDPVVYRDDIAPDDWTELRRRFGEENQYLDEMFGVQLEARAEGAAVIDIDGDCSDVRFPRGGSTGHAALSLLESLCARHRDGAELADVDEEMAVLIDRYGRYWRKDANEDPVAFRDEVIELLTSMGLATVGARGRVTPRPAAARFVPHTVLPDTDPDGPVQGSLM